MARLIQVIETSELRGKGIEGDPMRRVQQFFSIDGELLAENDSHAVTLTVSEYKKLNGEVVTNKEDF